MSWFFVSVDRPQIQGRDVGGPADIRSPARVVSFAIYNLDY